MSDRPKLGEAARALLDALGIDGPGPEKRMVRAALAPVKVPEMPSGGRDPYCLHGDSWRFGYYAALRDLGLEVSND